MSDFEDNGRIKCTLSYTDERGSTTVLSHDETMYRDHELEQLAEYFKQLLYSIGYIWVDEVQIINNSNERVYSSES